MHIRAPTDSQTALAPSHGIASSQTGTVVAKLLPAQIELLPKVVESQPRSSQVEVDVDVPATSADDMSNAIAMSFLPEKTRVISEWWHQHKLHENKVGEKWFENGDVWPLSGQK